MFQKLSTQIFLVMLQASHILIGKVDNDSDLLTKPLKPNVLAVAKQHLHFICCVGPLESSISIALGSSMCPEDQGTLFTFQQFVNIR